MSAPIVTVLTPTLDAERFLSPMLSSLAGQTLASTAIEHIVIDGGSKDGTLERIRRESPATRIIVAPKSSIYDAMNIGLAEAKGACIGWLNADDVWNPGALAEVASTLASRPDAGIVIGDYDMFDGARRWQYASNRDALERIRAGRMARWFDVWVNPLAVFFRTELLRELGGYDPAYRLVGDWDLWFRAAARSTLPTIAHTGTRLGSFRIHPGSLTSGSRIDRLLEDKRKVTTRWIEDPTAPEGVRACARRMFRHDTLALWALRAKEGSPGAAIRDARVLGASLRAVGGGMLGDVGTGALIALHEVAQSVPGLGAVARAAWAATGGPRVSSNS